MKKIEEIYAVLTTENGEETICAMNMGPTGQMQAISSNKKLMESLLSILTTNFPEKDFKIISFRRCEA